MNPGYWYAWTPNQIPGDIVGFTIFSNDTLNNWNSFSSSFSIVDTTKPIIHGIDILPSVSQVNDIVQIKASVIDNYLVDLVWAEITKPSLSTTNIVLNKTYEPDEDGNHSIIVFANDTSGNTANSSHYFIVLNPENITLTPSAYITVISIGSSNITTLTINNTGDITTVVNIYDSSQSWVIYSNTTFDVENKSAVNITINITVPQDTIPGDYVYLVTANTSIAQDTANLYITVPDEQPPIIHNIIYNNITFGNNQTIIVNATDNKQIDVCSIDYNGTNITMDNCSYTYMPEEVGLINFAVYVNDTSGNINASQEQYIVTDINEPNIISYSILPKAVIIDKNISIDINATDDYMINYTWANITKPDSNFTMLYLPANYTATQVGRYNITFFVNDTSDNTANATDYFISQNEMIFNGSISDGNYSPISTNTTFYFSQTENIISNINTTGNFSVSLPEYLYDIKISLENQTILTLNQVNLSLNNEKEILIEMPANSLDLRTCAINTTYIYGTATLVLSYNNTAYSNENYISAYKCNEWNFVGQECLSGWERYANATQNKDCKLFTIYTNSFSAFSLKQDSYCGNGICNSDESCSSCSDDCGSCSSSSS
ncbi:MAG: hypothetical protein KAQ92_04340, partial [Candidatus Aenigmarchaeota archaeon]|nr:hypothetical protein [Candidatus Aenigmarchaeota archaeon]